MDITVKAVCIDKIAVTVLQTGCDVHVDTAVFLTEAAKLVIVAVDLPVAQTLGARGLVGRNQRLNKNRHIRTAFPDSGKVIIPVFHRVFDTVIRRDIVHADHQEQLLRTGLADHFACGPVFRTVGDLTNREDILPD